MKFTQFLRPNGRRREIGIIRPQNIEDDAAYLVSLGYKLEIEELMDGTVSMTVEGAQDFPLAIELCPNGPLVPSHVDILITEARKTHDSKKHSRADKDVVR